MLALALSREQNEGVWPTHSDGRLSPMPPHDMIQSLQQAIGHGGEQVFDVAPIVLRRVLEDRLWADRKDKNGNPFPSFEAFATHILWQGLESSIGDLLLYCRKHEEVAKLIRRGRGGRARAPGRCPQGWGRPLCSISQS
jgi:hypothetical protein